LIEAANECMRRVASPRVIGRGFLEIAEMNVAAMPKLMQHQNAFTFSTSAARASAHTKTMAGKVQRKKNKDEGIRTDAVETARDCRICVSPSQFLRQQPLLRRCKNCESVAHDNKPTYWNQCQTPLLKTFPE